MGRQARVFYEEGWPWSGKPWPWCPFVPIHPNGTIKPHDNHVVNGGNTNCPGHPGIVEDDFL